MNVFMMLGLSVLLHGYIGLRLSPGLAPWPAAWLLLLAVLAVSALVMPLGLMARRVARPQLAWLLSWAGLLCMGLFSSLLVLTLLRDAALGLLWLAGLLAPGALPLARWSVFSAQAVPLLAGLATLLGFLNARRTAAVVRVNVPIRGLPPAWQGFSVA